ncbi:cation:proton antiporter [Armatimonas rosea]|uniref:CPA1 family monovalent cation:H+ antiporter n=1 Tax=Armatimonas rosea TaxID=685828 RepID=A0A7W9SVV2_ARMRO|nr:sodium:proton antiporter [Armatimonas rosea]MBB6053812.1 CPA1 family monovalent cation:H+ antiporter [Armatimonas rosea]
MLPVERIAFLLLIVCLTAMAARRLRLPYTIGLIAAGTALSLTGLLAGVALTKELIFSALLPPLIFEAAFYIPWTELRADSKPILLLATLGVLLATGLTAAGMHFLAGWEWQAATVFGTLIAATDPVSVIATFKEAGVHGRLRLLVEAESLFNDGTAAVLFGVVLAWASSGQVSVAHIGLDLLREVGGGCGMGLLVGFFVLWIAGHTDDHLVEIALTVVAAYGSFLLAQHFHCSGVLATLCCGLLLGNRGSLGSITDAGHEAVGSFWEFAAFLVNSVIFLLIGASEKDLLRELVHYGVPLLIATGIVTLGRGVAVYPLCALFARSPLAISLAHQHILFWGGLRGALALALVLGLPESLPRRAELIAVTFGVVAFSVIVQGLTVTPLLKRLKLH